MTHAPILVPLEAESRFIWGDADHLVERLPIYPPRSLRFDRGASPLFSSIEVKFHTVERQIFDSPHLGCLMAFSRREDAPRLLVALQAAEGVILFVAWLKRAVG